MRRGPGFSLVECLVAMTLAAILCMSAFALWSPGPALAVAREELAGCLDEARTRARARGVPVRVALKGLADGDIVPLHLPVPVKWGKPPQVPLPPGMKPPRRAATTGEAHVLVTFTPQLTANAACWFIHDGQDVVCARLSDHGRVQMLRWRHRAHCWTRG
jgi:prepilin-type N-terminal cleavage/methylation domain-containing protein